MNTMFETNESVVGYVRDHLLAQGRQSADPETGRCLYLSLIHI